MAKKEALRELQSRLAERLQAARTQTRGRSWLAVESAARGFLFPLKEAGEIFPLGPLVPVPHTHRWFLGVSNLRGHLHGVVDLAGFLGVKPEAPATPATQGQLVGFNQALDLNCVLLVDKLAGLRSEEQLTPDTEPADSHKPSFVGASYRDASGRAWQELNLAALAGDESFLRIVG